LAHRSVAAVDDHQVDALARHPPQAREQLALLFGHDVQNVVRQRRASAACLVAVAALVPDDAGADQRDSQETTRALGVAKACTYCMPWTARLIAVHQATR